MLPYAGQPRDRMKVLHNLLRDAWAAHDRGDERLCKKLGGAVIDGMLVTRGKED